MSSKIVKKAAGKINSAGKSLYQSIRYRRSWPDTLLFVMGCQRSGTSMMGEMLKKDYSSLVLGEFSPMSSKDVIHNIRLNPLEDLDTYLGRVRAPFVVAKPLVESQNARKYLDYFKELKILWLFRDYRDVAQSNVVKFGDRKGITDIRSIIEREAGNWRAEFISDEVRSELEQQFTESMGAPDAAALFWYSRNQLLFSQQLEDHPRVYVCSYQDLVERPGDVVPDIYHFLGREFPGRYLYSDVHSSSVGKGGSINLSGTVDLMCSNLMGELLASKNNT